MSSRQPLQSPSWSKAVMISAFIFSRCKSIRSSRLSRKFFVLDIMSSTNHSDGQLHISEQIQFVYLISLRKLNIKSGLCTLQYRHVWKIVWIICISSIWICISSFSLSEDPQYQKWDFHSPISGFEFFESRQSSRIISPDRLISWNWTPPQCNRNSPTSLFNQMLNSAVLRFPETKDCVQISWN